MLTEAVRCISADALVLAPFAAVVTYVDNGDFGLLQSIAILRAYIQESVICYCRHNVRYTDMPATKMAATQGYKDAQPLSSHVEGAFRPANAALCSHSKCAVLSFCASREGATGRHLKKYLPVVAAISGEDAR